MKWLKIFNESNHSNIDISRTEINKLRELNDFDFFRTESLGVYIIIGKRKSLPMEFITITKDDSDNFNLEIRKSSGYEGGGNSKFRFETIDEIKKFLLEYEWYDLKH